MGASTAGSPSGTFPGGSASGRGTEQPTRNACSTRPWCTASPCLGPMLQEPCSHGAWHVLVLWMVGNDTGLWQQQGATVWWPCTIYRPRCNHPAVAALRQT